MSITRGPHPSSYARPAPAPPLPEAASRHGVAEHSPAFFELLCRLSSAGLASAGDQRRPAPSGAADDPYDCEAREASGAACDERPEPRRDPAERERGDGRAAPPPAEPRSELRSAAAVAERSLAGASAPSELSVQQLASQHLRGVSIQRLDGRTSLKLELSARGLPRLGLRLQLEAGVLNARLSVPDRAARESLRCAAAELEAALLKTGVRQATVDVELASEEPRRDRRGRQRPGLEQVPDEVAASAAALAAPRSFRALLL